MRFLQKWKNFNKKFNFLQKVIKNSVLPLKTLIKGPHFRHFRGIPVFSFQALSRILVNHFVLSLSVTFKKYLFCEEEFNCLHETTTSRGGFLVSCHINTLSEEKISWIHGYCKTWWRRKKLVWTASEAIWQDTRTPPPRCGRFVQKSKFLLAKQIFL